MVVKKLDSKGFYQPLMVVETFENMFYVVQTTGKKH